MSSSSQNQTLYGPGDYRPDAGYWEQLERMNRRKSAAVTALICLLLLLTLLLLGLRPPFPPPPEEGLMIDFGTTATGLGETNPRTQVQTPPPPTPAEAPDPVQGAAQQVLDESVALPPPKPDANPEPVKRPDKPQPQEAPPTPPQPDPEPQPEPIDERFVFKSDKHRFESSSGSEGNTQGPGNMGNPSGGSSGQYEGMASGLGDKGISFGLSGRGMVGIPPTDNAHQEYGDIRITIRVNQQGEVIFAEYSRQGSTITNRALIDKYVAFARKAKFNPDSKAPEVQQGHITFRLTLR